VFGINITKDQSNSQYWVRSSDLEKRKWKFSET